MNLNFKSTKIPIYDIENSAGISYPRRTGTRDSNTHYMSLIHISEPTRPLYISYAVFCLKKKKKKHQRRSHVYPPY
ncbi:hypothetical protein CDFC105_81599 [Clostridioides difficile]|nr:hypothetical protein CDFC105_81599 [Clostridioides difficile]